ncbi:hypothetical protein HKD37_19G053724 [Glycine soja]
MLLSLSCYHQVMLLFFGLMTTKELKELMPIKVGNGKWHGSVGGILCAPIDKVWTLVSKTKRLLEWMPMVERCSSLDGDDDEPGYVRLVLGFVFPQQDGERSWIKESLVSLDSSSHNVDGVVLHAFLFP